MFPSFDRDTVIPVLYRDDQLIAVHKPAGMVVHPTDLAREETVSLMLLVRRMVRQRVWPMHRLDRPTSGIVLFALNREAGGELGHLLRRRLKHIFHPIIGDTTYGDGAHNRHFRE